MSNVNDEDEFDATLRAHLVVELDGQLGRAERAFHDRLRLAPAADASGVTSSRRPRRLRSHAWVIGATGAAVAASLAAMWIGPVRPSQPPGGPSAINLKEQHVEPVAVSPSGSSKTVTDDAAATGYAPQWRQVEQVVNSMTVDKGIVVLEDNTPARLVRRVALEQVEWVDPRTWRPRAGGRATRGRATGAGDHILKPDVRPEESDMSCRRAADAFDRRPSTNRVARLVAATAAGLAFLAMPVAPVLGQDAPVVEPPEASDVRPDEPAAAEPAPRRFPRRPRRTTIRRPDG